MEKLLFINLYFFIIALVLAILEIQIEGPSGWARNLPTWKPSANIWYSKLYSKLMSGKALTGYHLTLFIFILLIFHLPFVFGLPFELVTWVQILSLFFMFTVLWDFLWFILNPSYPLKQFKSQHISWHKKWFLGIPLDYYLGLILSFMILIPVDAMTPRLQLINWWLINIAFFIVQIFVVYLFATHLLKIDQWRK
jgi:hypothetical protein